MTFAKEAWPFVLPWCLLGVALVAYGRWGWTLAVLAVAALVLLFFRNPQRSFAGDDAVILAPADGVVTALDTVEDEEVGPGPRQRIVTFLSVFDVHVQRVPTSGRVIAARSREGRKVAAFKPEAGAINAGHLTVIERPGGERIGVRQIAGLLARRVVPYLGRGDRVLRGQELGIIKFGSRVDLLLPPGYAIQVEEGDRLRAGLTPVAVATSETP